jgi:hypothetical protein
MMWLRPNLNAVANPRVKNKSVAVRQSHTGKSLWAHLKVAPFDSNHETNDAFEKVFSPFHNIGRIQAH